MNKAKEKAFVKKGMAALLSCAVAFSYVPVTAVTAQAATGETITCDISKGSVTIGNTDSVTGNSDSITYTDSDGTLHTGVSISSKTHIVITGTTKENTVMVRDYDTAPIDITFKDLNIDVTEIPAADSGYVSTCAVYFGGESTGFPQGRVNLTLEGSNTIKSLDYAGIAVPMGEQLTIGGTGSLDVSSVKGNASVSGPGIGAPVSTNNPPAYIASEKLDTSFGTITINGGTINATSGITGIGGGQGCMAGNIVINGGDITAIAGEGSAAGIGCGQDSVMGSILITGGKVNAAGSNAGPGIGSGGMHTDSGVITITGGDITATGGNFAPGIGGSNTNGWGHGDATQIHIYGGTIRAYGGKAAAGIGAGGPYGLADDITIKGGTIYAYGGAGTVTVGDHFSRQMVDGKMSMVKDGTQTAIYSAGAGIGNGGATFSVVNYTSGNKAGQTVVSGTARFGGSVTVTGGTVNSYKGAVTDEEQALIAEAGFTYNAAEAIGNGGYVAENITEDTPYVASKKTITGGTVSENGTVTHKPDDTKTPAADAKTDICTATVSGISKAVYTGEAITPEVVVTLNGKVLAKNTDYTVTYKDNKEAGLATATITGIGSYTGCKDVAFLITDPTVSKCKAPKITVGKKKMTVKVSKVSGATGYKVYYKVRGAKKWKTKTIGKSGKTTIKSLKTGKKYTVKVLTLKKVGTKTFKAAAKSAAKTSKKIK